MSLGVRLTPSFARFKPDTMTSAGRLKRVGAADADARAEMHERLREYQRTLPWSVFCDALQTAEPQNRAKGRRFQPPSEKR